MLLQIMPPVRATGLEMAIAANRTRARRRWIIRATLSLSFSAAVLILLVILQRDQMAISDCLQSMSRPLAALQAQVDDLGQLPAVCPDVPARTQFSYAPDLVREYARESTGPVIVGSSATQPLLLGSDGNGVLIYEDGQLRCEWWSRVSFVREWQAQNVRIRKWDQQRHAAPPQLP
jgi:hypothetical protein